MTGNQHTIDREVKKGNDWAWAVGDSSQASISAEIQALFRRPGAAPARRYNDNDSESGIESDMEAGFSDVEEEELRAGQIARREDMLAEKDEAERKRKKDLMRRQRAREKGR